MTSTVFQQGTVITHPWLNDVNEATYVDVPANTAAIVAETSARTAYSTSIAAPSGSSLVGQISTGTGSVARTVQSKLRESVSVKDFGAVGDGVTDDTAAIQACFDYACPEREFLTYPDDSIYAVYFPPGVYAVTNLLLRHRLSTNSDNRQWRIYGDGVRIEQIAGSTGPTFEISSCKRLLIDALSIDEVWITGLWDSNITNLSVDTLKFGTRNASGTNLFASNYWSHFNRCRIGSIDFTIYSGGQNQEFNANQFTACIAGPITITGNANGSFQGNIFTGGELRGNPFISIDAANTSGTPNSLTIVSTYFDQTGIQTNLYNFQIKTLGSCPAVNGYVLDGQPLSGAGSNQEIALVGVRTGQRLPVSSVNFIVNGDHNSSAVGEATVPGVSLYNTTAVVASTSGTGPFSKYVTYTSTGTFPYAIYATNALPYDATYTMTIIYKKPASNAFSIRWSNSAGANAYNAFANESSYFLGDWIVASYTFNATAGTSAYGYFYSSVTAQSIDVAYVGCTMGATGLIYATGTQTTVNQPQVLWRSVVPSTGTWARGAIVYNTEPASAGFIGWVCTTAGTPGTWKTFGVIS